MLPTLKDFINRLKGVHSTVELSAINERWVPLLCKDYASKKISGITERWKEGSDYRSKTMIASQLQQDYHDLVSCMVIKDLEDVWCVPGDNLKTTVDLTPDFLLFHAAREEVVIFEFTFSYSTRVIKAHNEKYKSVATETGSDLRVCADVPSNPFVFQSYKVALEEKFGVPKTLLTPEDNNNISFMKRLWGENEKYLGLGDSIGLVETAPVIKILQKNMKSDWFKEAESLGRFSELKEIREKNLSMPVEEAQRVLVEIAASTYYHSCLKVMAESKTESEKNLTKLEIDSLTGRFPWLKTSALDVTKTLNETFYSRPDPEDVKRAFAEQKEKMSASSETINCSPANIKPSNFLPIEPDDDVYASIEKKKTSYKASDNEAMMNLTHVLATVYPEMRNVRDILGMIGSDPSSLTLFESRKTTGAPVAQSSSEMVDDLSKIMSNPGNKDVIREEYLKNQELLLKATGKTELEELPADQRADLQRVAAMRTIKAMKKEVADYKSLKGRFKKGRNVGTMFEPDPSKEGMKNIFASSTMTEVKTDLNWQSDGCQAVGGRSFRFNPHKFPELNFKVRESHSLYTTPEMKVAKKLRSALKVAWDSLKSEKMDDVVLDEQGKETTLRNIAQKRVEAIKKVISREEESVSDEKKAKANKSVDFLMNVIKMKEVEGAEELERSLKEMINIVRELEHNSGMTVDKKLEKDRRVKTIPVNEKLGFNTLVDFKDRCELFAAECKTPVKKSDLHIDIEGCDSAEMQEIKKQMFESVEDRTGKKVRNSNAMKIAMRASTLVSQIIMASMPNERPNVIHVANGGCPNIICLIAPGASLTKKKDGHAFNIYGITDKPEMFKNSYFGSHCSPVKIGPKLWVYQSGWNRLNLPRLQRLVYLPYELYATSLMVNESSLTLKDSSSSHETNLFATGAVFQFLMGCRTDVNYPQGLLRPLLIGVNSPFPKTAALIRDKLSFRIKSTLGATMINYLEAQTLSMLNNYSEKVEKLMTEDSTNMVIKSFSFNGLKNVLTGMPINTAQGLFSTIYTYVLQPSDLDGYFAGFMSQIDPTVELQEKAKLQKKENPDRFYGIQDVKDFCSTMISDFRCNHRIYAACMIVYYNTIQPNCLPSAFKEMERISLADETIYKKNNTRATKTDNLWKERDAIEIDLLKGTPKNTKVFTETLRRGVQSNKSLKVPPSPDKGEFDMTDFLKLLEETEKNCPRLTWEKKIQKLEPRLFYVLEYMWKYVAAYVEECSIAVANNMPSELITQKKNKLLALKKCYDDSVAMLSEARNRFKGLELEPKLIHYCADLTKFAPTWMTHTDIWDVEYWSMRGMRKDLSMLSEYLHKAWVNKKIEIPEDVRRQLPITRDRGIKREDKFVHFETNGCEGMKNVHWSIANAVCMEAAIWASKKVGSIINGNCMAHSDDEVQNLIYVTMAGVNAHIALTQILLGSRNMKINFKKSIFAKFFEMTSDFIINSTMEYPFIKVTGAFNSIASADGPENDSKQVLSKITDMFAKGMPGDLAYYLVTTVGKMMGKLYNFSEDHNKPLICGGAPNCLPSVYMTNINFDMIRIAKYGDQKYKKVVKMCSAIRPDAIPKNLSQDLQQKDIDFEWAKLRRNMFFASKINTAFNLIFDKFPREEVFNAVEKMKREYPFIGMYKPKSKKWAFLWQIGLLSSPGMKSAFAPQGYNKNALMFATMSSKPVWGFIVKKTTLAAVLSKKTKQERFKFFVKEGDEIGEYYNLQQSKSTTGLKYTTTRKDSDSWLTDGIDETKGLFCEVSGKLREIQALIVDLSDQEMTDVANESDFNKHTWINAGLLYDCLERQGKPMMRLRMKKRAMRVRQVALGPSKQSFTNSPMNVLIWILNPQFAFEERIQLIDISRVKEDVKLIEEVSGVLLTKENIQEHFSKIIAATNDFEKKTRLSYGDYSKENNLTDFYKESIEKNSSALYTFSFPDFLSSSVTTAYGKVWSSSPQGQSEFTSRSNLLRACYLVFLTSRCRKESKMGKRESLALLESMRVIEGSKDILTGKKLLQTSSLKDFADNDKTLFAIMKADLLDEKKELWKVLFESQNVVKAYEKEDFPVEAVEGESPASKKKRSVKKPQMICHQWVNNDYCMIKTKAGKRMFFNRVVVNKDINEYNCPYDFFLPFQRENSVSQLLRQCLQAVGYRLALGRQPSSVLGHPITGNEMEFKKFCRFNHFVLITTIASPEPHVMTTERALGNKEVITFFPDVKIIQNSDDLILKSQVSEDSFTVERGLVMCQLDIRKKLRRQLSSRSFLFTTSPLKVGACQLDLVEFDKNSLALKETIEGILHADEVLNPSFKAFKMSTQRLTYKKLNDITSRLSYVMFASEIINRQDMLPFEPEIVNEGSEVIEKPQRSPKVEMFESKLDLMMNPGDIFNGRFFKNNNDMLSVTKREFKDKPEDIYKVCGVVAACLRVIDLKLEAIRENKALVDDREFSKTLDTFGGNLQRVFEAAKDTTKSLKLFKTDDDAEKGGWSLKSRKCIVKAASKLEKGIALDTGETNCHSDVKSMLLLWKSTLLASYYQVINWIKTNKLVPKDKGQTDILFQKNVEIGQVIDMEKTLGKILQSGDMEFLTSYVSADTDKRRVMTLEKVRLNPELKAVQVKVSSCIEMIKGKSSTSAKWISGIPPGVCAIILKTAGRINLSMLTDEQRSLVSSFLA